jgi:iron complex transport system substrate-binding protein
MKRLLWILATLSLVLSACRGAASETSTSALTIEDARGREVAFEEPPQRIVIAGKANFMLNDTVYLFPERARERVVALTRASQGHAFIKLLDPQAEEKLRFRVDAGADVLASAKPDVVLLKSFMADSIGSTLETLEIPVLYLDFETPAQYDRDLVILGQLFADPERADEVWSFYETRMEDVQAATSDLAEAEKPRVLMLQYSDRGGEVAFKVPPATWIQTEMVERAGGVPVWSETAPGGGWVVVNLEQIAAWDPEQIYLINYFSNVDETAEKLRADPQWQQLQAVQQGQLHAFPKDFYSWDQPDTRWILGLMWLTEHIHPQLLDIEIEDELYAFYERLYGMDTETVTSEVLPRLQGDLDG